MGMKYLLPLFVVVVTICSAVTAAPKKIKVFVALCDNKTQGIAPVGKKIGDGDKPDANLYWGCSDGIQCHFKKTGKWTYKAEKKDVSAQVLRRLTYEHKATKSMLVADAYKGSEIKQCYIDFEKALLSGEYDLVCFIGHNVLMDGHIAQQKGKAKKKTDAVALCCVSDSWMSGRLKALGGQPVLMTRSLMYPGSFILHDSLEVWFKGGTKEQIRSAAGKAYGKNQKISHKAGMSVFKKLP